LHSAALDGAISMMILSLLKKEIYRYTIAKLSSLSCYEEKKEGGGGENYTYTFLLDEHIEITEGTDRMDSMINYPKTSVSILKTSIAYKNNYFDVFTKKKHLNMIKHEQSFIEFHIHIRHPSFLADIP